MASSKPISLYIAERTFTAIREKDSASGRVNQIVDRWLEVLKTELPAVRADFDNDEWETLVQSWERVAPPQQRNPLPAIAARATLLRELEAEPILVEKVADLTMSDFFVMIEGLELERNKPMQRNEPLRKPGRPARAVETA